MDDMSNDFDNAFGGSSSAEDEEVTLPRASLNKMIKEVLPDLRVANESRELILNCCSEFIHILSSEASKICTAQQRKTLNPEHILSALDKMGFSSFRKNAEEVMAICKEKRRKQSTRLENLGIPEEELLRQQQELFAKAKEEQAQTDLTQWQAIQMATMSKLVTEDDDGDNYD